MIDKSEFADPDPDLQVWSLSKSSIQIQLVDIIYKIRLFCKSKESHESLVLKTSQILQARSLQKVQFDSNQSPFY